MPVALITGAAQGIGRQLALHLTKDGYAIAALDIDAGGLKTLAEEIVAGGGRCAVVTADVTEPEALRNSALALEQQLGPIDLAIANAGIGIETSAYDLRPSHFKRVIDINLLGVVNTVAAVLPGMLGRGRGHLVALSSLASFHGLPRLLAYSTSKAAVTTFMEGVRAEVKPAGLEVSTICPGWIRTAMTAPVQDKLPDLMELDYAVTQILAAIRKKRLYTAFPRSLAWRLRLLNALPRSWQDSLIAKMVGKVRP